MRRLLALPIALALLVACGDDDDSTATIPDETSTTTTEAASGSALPTDACNRAFAEAAAVDDMHDSVSDLYPAAKACESLDDWTAAHEANPGAIDADPATFATNVCLYGPDEDPDLADAPLCQELNG